VIGSQSHAKLDSHVVVWPEQLATDLKNARKDIVEDAAPGRSWELEG
jgi:hypothetical protein